MSLADVLSSSLVTLQEDPSACECAAQGDAAAQYHLGLMYAKGLGVPQDNVQAVEWLRKAAEQGNPNAQLSIGRLYAEGEGLPQDDTQAVSWFRKAADQGVAEAQSFLASQYYMGKGVEKDDAQAAYWWTSAAKLENVIAQFNVGAMYRDGIGLSQDYEQAAHWFTLAATQGYANAKLLLGLLYESGLGVVQDYSRAASLYREAAAQDSHAAKFQLGLLYEKGLGVAQDYKQAAECYQDAVEKGNNQARERLLMLGKLPLGDEWEYREVDEIFNDAALLVAAPERVYDWLKAQFDKADIDAFPGSDAGDDFHRIGRTQCHTEVALFHRRHPLIDLGLARYSVGDLVQKCLLERYGDDSLEGPIPSQTFRCALFSNPTIPASYAISCLTGKEDVNAFLKRISNRELQALLENRNIDYPVFTTIVNALVDDELFSSEQKKLCLQSLANNRSTHREFKWGWQYDSRSRDCSEFEVASWRLAERLGPDSNLTTHLSWYLANLYVPHKAFEPRELLAWAARWPDSEYEKNPGIDDDYYDDLGLGGEFREIRSGSPMIRLRLARHAISTNKDIADELLSSDDYALRAAAYETVEAISVEQMQAGFERDRALFLNHLSKNTRHWRSEHVKLLFKMAFECKFAGSTLIDKICSVSGHYSNYQRRYLEETLYGSWPSDPGPATRDDLLRITGRPEISSPGHYGLDDEAPKTPTLIDIDQRLREAERGQIFLGRLGIIILVLSSILLVRSCSG